ncbi:MAG: Sec-independent protein translocase protein TatB [Niameybacter sp.]|uniref:Sec-independent protein translocase protein TatB n=1 Tax=Niameybacter sp. TaxID=2033640 RepID=UPI002FCB55C5
MKIGFFELIIIFIVALIVLGPEKLPLYAKKLGQALSTFKDYSGKFVEEMNTSIAEPLKEVSEPLQKIAKEVSEPLTEVKATINQIGKPISSVKTTSTPVKTTE